MNIKQIKNNKLKTILQFSIPSIIAMLLQTVITITDGYFTGNYVGDNALAAINLGLPILYVYLGAGLCVGVGGSVISGRLLGAKNRQKALRALNNTLNMSMSISFGSNSKFHFRKTSIVFKLIMINTNNISIHSC